MGNNEYYESVIKLIVMLDTKEIRAKRYEGYWRYPQMMDFCYLVNPYHPSQKMIEEMKANFEALLTQYPSGMRVNSLLASKKFGVNQDYIVIGNGAAELIQILMGSMQGRIEETYPEGLYIVKSISKSYGIPGIRLGIIASADKAMIREIKSGLPIWNINSFGEFYMQIEEKYHKNYVAAVDKMKSVRKEFMGKLKQIPYLRVIPSQANYVMCEIINGIKGIDLACFLLEKNILIKDLSEKIGDGKQYIRLAVRREEENEYLLACLYEYGK